MVHRKPFLIDISLDEIADTAGLSRYHLSRVFGLDHRPFDQRLYQGSAPERGRPCADRRPIDHSRGCPRCGLRLARGFHPCLPRAIRHDAGQFAQTGARSQPCFAGADQNGRHPPSQTRRAAFRDPPRNAARRPCGNLCLWSHAGIPSLWQKFNQYFGHIPGQIGNVAYGVCTQAEGETESFRYMSAAEVSRRPTICRRAFTTLKLPPQRYAVFTHRGHVSGISATVHQIFGDWLPQSGHQHGGVPDMMERYDDRFDPQTGMGANGNMDSPEGIELCAPLAKIVVALAPAISLLTLATIIEEPELGVSVGSTLTRGKSSMRTLWFWCRIRAPGLRLSRSSSWRWCSASTTSSSSRS